MEIQVRRLRDALGLVKPAVPRKPTLPVLSYVRLGEGLVAATNLEVAVTIELPGADEEVLLPVKDALGFLKYTLGAATARISRDRGRVSIAAGRLVTSFSEVPDPRDFPPLPRVEAESEGVLNGDALVRALLAVAPYAATETSRPVLNGVYLATGDELEVAAADGFSLIWERIPGRLSGPSMIIPAKAVDILEHLWKAAAAPDLSGVRDAASLAIAPRLIRLGWGKGLLRFSFGVATIIVRLIEGTFPNYKQLIPSETLPPVIVDTEDMQRALAQVAPAAKSVNGVVRLSWEGEALRVWVKGEEKQTAVSIPARFTEPGRTALNIDYLKKYFKGRAGLVSISPSSSLGPVLFAHKGKAHVLIMPMLVEWEPKPAVVAQAEQVVEQAQDETEAEEKPKRGRKKNQD